jgi:hypothetical protein
VAKRKLRIKVGGGGRWREGPGPNAACYGTVSLLPRISVIRGLDQLSSDI